MNHLRRIVVVGSLLGLLTAALAGCGPAIGWFVAQFAPPQKVRAVYDPPKKKCMLVLVDDYYHTLESEMIVSELTHQLSGQLRQHKIARETVNHDHLVELMAATPQFGRLSVGEVGERLGADVVLYVLIDRFSLKDEQASPLWRGRLQVTVKMVDTKAGRLWPTDRPAGYPLPAVQLPPTDELSETYASQLTRTLAARAADSIAKLFYSHHIPAQQRPQNFGG